MWFFRRRTDRTPPSPPTPSFGEWVLRSFTNSEPIRDMTFARLEQVCSNAASLLCGAAYAEPDALRDAAPDEPALAGEAALLARRTADAFKAALSDRDHTVLAWPWDHLATKVAWEATRSGKAAEAPVGDELWQISAIYATQHRRQLEHVLTVWDQVAAGVLANAATPRPSLEAMGREALLAYRRQFAGAGTGPN